MKRWHKLHKEDVEIGLVDDFLKDVHEIFKKHGMCIAHEDTQGGFIIEAYDNSTFEWLNQASIGKTIKCE